MIRRSRGSPARRPGRRLVIGLGGVCLLPLDRGSHAISLLRQKSRFVVLTNLAAERSWPWINYTSFIPTVVAAGAWWYHIRTCR